MDCPDDAALAALVADRAGDTERAALLAHLDACAACRELVGEVVAGDEPDADRPLATGDLVGRFQLERVLGAGGVGVVYAARDPELQRLVALKLLRPGVLHDGQHLVAEAQALARLSHPNLMTVHEVGVAGDRVFIAMELVDGATLRAWLAAAPRRWPAIREVFGQAGRGLAAAHAAGVVHRDFKPDNVLVGADGRVRVTDFGLAYRDGAASPGDGRVVGTPAYMPPEQRAAGPVDERADVYSFSVALFEALHGHRPAEGERATRGPRRVRRAVDRGRARDPASRPRLRELLAALQPWRWTGLVGGVALLAVAAGTAFAIGRVGEDPCARDEWGSIWDGDARARAAARVDPAIFATVDASFTAYRGRWIDARRGVCRAHDAATLEQRQGCLEERRREAEEASLLLATADLGERGVDLVHGLSSVDDCVSAGAAQPLPAAEVALADRLIELKSRFDAGQRRECLAAARAGLREVRAAGDPGLLGRWLYYLARCENEAQAIEDDLHESAVAAEAGRDDRTLARAWTRLVYHEGFYLHRWDEAARAAAFAQAVIDHIGGDRQLELALLRDRALAADARGTYEEASALLPRMRELAIALDGPDSPSLVATEVLDGNIFLDRYRFTEASVHHRRALALGERIYGASSVGLVDALINLAEDEQGVGHAAAALAIYDRLSALSSRPMDDPWLRRSWAQALRLGGDPARAFAINQAALAECEARAGKDAIPCAIHLEGVGRDLVDLGRLDEAAPVLERAERLYAGTGEPESPYWLARALVTRDPARARGLALAARANLAALIGDRVEDRYLLDQVEAWLREHGGLP